jgi:hypothetical protein
MTLYRGGCIRTMDPLSPLAEAMLARDGVVLAVGSEAECRARAHGPADVVELEGRWLLPGFFDSHLHLSRLGEALSLVDLRPARSARQAAELMAERARATEATARGGWVIGFGWDQNRWDAPRLPSAADLDAALSDRPAIARRIDIHALWCNRMTLTLAGIHAGTPDPPGGRIERDEQGEPTGLLIDRAMGLVERLVPTPSHADRRASLRRAVAEVRRFGITAVNDAFIDAADRELLLELHAAGELPLRVFGMLDGTDDTLLSLASSGSRQPGLASGERSGSDRFAVPDPRLGPIFRQAKLFADGALGSRGARLLAPYADAPGEFGLALADRETILRVGRRCQELGLQLCIHAIGDAANRTVLDAYEALATADSDFRRRRFRIEHAQIVHPNDLPRFGRLGILAAIQTSHLASDCPWVADRIGRKRCPGAYAWRTLVDGGAELANGSDAPIEPVDPRLGLRAAINRQTPEGWPDGGWYPEQRLTPAEALHGYTLGAARGAHAERWLGSFAPGKLADAVIVDRDPLDSALPMSFEILGSRLAGE